MKRRKSFFDRIRSLPLVAKIVLGSIIPVAALFILSTNSLSEKNKQFEQDVSENQTLEQAEGKFEEAKLALIIGDEEKASALLDEAKKLQGQTAISPDNQSRAEKLTTDINEQFDKIINISRVSLTPLITFGNTVKLEQLVPAGSITYSFDPETNSIYEVDQAKKDINDLKVESANIGFITHGTYLERTDELIFFTDTPSIASYGLKNNKLVDEGATLLSKNQSIKDIASYGSKIYLLDTTSNQIVSHISTSNGFGKGSEWITDKSSVTNATSFTIDGNIWVLNNDGSILKFLSGTKETFTTEPLNEPMKNPVDIATTEDSNYLYIADPQNKRIVTYDKKGAFVNQVFADEFETLTSITIDPPTSTETRTTQGTTETLTIIANNNLYQINPHTKQEK